MWPFLKKARTSQSADAQNVERPRRRPMLFEDLIADMGDFSDLAEHDAALKFWLPEPVDAALKELCARGGESMSEMLRRFLAQHCYGVYAVEVMREALPGLFRDLDEMLAVLRFSKSPPNTPTGKARVDTYWVPELGKNVAPIKVWVPSRLRSDLEVLAAHVDIKLSQYVREIVISRLLGHGTLPKRPQMLEAAPLSAAEDWCEDHEVPMRPATVEEYRAHPEGEHTVEWVDEATPRA
jgi:hypothetical protein